MRTDELREYLAIFRRYWWIVIGSAVVAGGAAWWAQHDDIPEYTAEALLQKRSEAPVMSLGSRAPQLGDRFASEVELIRSRSVLQSVVDSVGLQFRLRERQDERSRIVDRISVERDAPGGGYLLSPTGSRLLMVRTSTGDTLGTVDPDSTISGPGFELSLADPRVARQPISFYITNRQGAINRLQGSLTVEPGESQDYLWLRYTSHDASLSAAVVNAVARSYQDYVATQATESARRRRDVIAEELVQLADSLRGVQNDLLEYQQQTRILSEEPEERALIQERIRLQDEIREMEFQLGLLETLTAGLESAGEGGESTDVIMARAAQHVQGGGALYQRLQDLEAERQRLTASQFGYTSENPKVQVVDSLIASTKNRMRVAANETLDQLRARYQNAQERLGDLQGRVSQAPVQSAELARRQQRVDAVQKVFNELVDRYYEAQIAEGVETGNVRIVDAAVVPRSPDPNRTMLSLILALMAGFTLGGVGAVAIDRLDTTVHDELSARDATSLELLGTVPRLKGGRKDANVRRLGKEAFRGLRTNLRFAGGTRAYASIAVTSPAPGEGKSTVAANLAVSMVEQGLRTLLIDGDLRRPQIHRVFEIARSPGLSEVLAGTSELSEAVWRGVVHNNLDVLTSGAATENASELLSGTHFADLVDRMRSHYDVVVVDTPPVLAVSDAVVVAKRMEGTIIVAKADQTEKQELSDAVDRLRRLEVPLIGVVLNQVPEERGDYYYSYDSYTADERGPDDAEGPSRRVLLTSGEETDTSA